MVTDLWSPIATSCNPLPGDAGAGKHSTQHVLDAVFGTGIGAVERKWPGFPTQPDHGAPFLHDGVLFGDEHRTSPFTWRLAINARCGPAAKASERSRRHFLHRRDLSRPLDPADALCGQSEAPIGFCRTRFIGTSTSKPPSNHGFARASVIPKFAPERATYVAIFAIGALMYAERKLSPP
jgi:hypothetical protein